MYLSSKSRFFLVWPFFTWRPEMTLSCTYYGHKAQEMILTDVSDTIHDNSLALFALNIDILLANVTKPQKMKILILTWPVTSSVTSRSNFWPYLGSSRMYRAIEWRLKFGNRSNSLGDLREGDPFTPPPPQQDVLLTIRCPRIIRTFYFDVLKEGQSNFIFCLYSAAWST